MTIICLNFRMVAYFAETVFPCDASKSVICMVFVLRLKQVRNFNCGFFFFVRLLVNAK
jgi:hypothetical protein